MDVTVLAPFLEPEPQAEMIFYAGDALNIYIGEPSSKYESDVETEVDFGKANFISFDDITFYLTTP